MSRKDSSIQHVLDRRDYLKGVGAAGLVGLAGCSGGDGATGSTEEEGPITVGILEDLSGNFAIAGVPKMHSTILAIEEINEEGGINGREVEYLDRDTQSENQRYRELARELIEDEEVDMLTGGFASSSREAIRPIVDRNEQLYFYSNEYEGGLCDSYTFAIGSIPEQQYSSLMPYMIDEFGPKVYTIAADYNFGQLSAEWIRKYTEENGGEIVGEEFIPLSVSGFGSTINNIQSSDADVLATVMVGSNQSAFFTQANSAGLDIPMASAVNLSQSYEHVRFNAPVMENMHSAVYYMEEIPSDRNQAFVDRFYDRWPDTTYINQMAESPYITMQLYKQAVEEAGTTDQETVIETLEDGMSVSAPEGDITLNGSTHHMSHNMRLTRVEEDHSVSFLDSETIEPTFLEEEIGCDLTTEDDTTQYTLDDAESDS